MESGKMVTVARWLLGIMMIVFGLNHIWPFMPAAELSGLALEFLTAMYSAGYFFPLVGIVMLLCGLMLVTKRYVPLALIMLAPVSVNIVLFHLFLAPAGIAVGLVVAILNLYLGIKHLDSYRSLF